MSWLTSNLPLLNVMRRQGQLELSFGSETGLERMSPLIPYQVSTDMPGTPLILFWKRTAIEARSSRRSAGIVVLLLTSTVTSAMSLRAEGQKKMLLVCGPLPVALGAWQ